MVFTGRRNKYFIKEPDTFLQGWGQPGSCVPLARCSSLLSSGCHQPGQLSAPSPAALSTTSTVSYSYSSYFYFYCLLLLLLLLLFYCLLLLLQHLTTRPWTWWWRYQGSVRKSLKSTESWHWILSSKMWRIWNWGSITFSPAPSPALLFHQLTSWPIIFSPVPSAFLLPHQLFFFPYLLPFCFVTCSPVPPPTLLPNHIPSCPITYPPAPSHTLLPHHSRVYIIL